MKIADDLRAKVAPTESAPPGPQSPTEEGGGNDRSQVLLTCIAAGLSTAATAWMIAGIFVGTLPKVVGVAGAAFGAAMVAASLRTRRPSVIQYLTLPGGLILGALLILSQASGSATVPSLVTEAIRTGGGVPPIPFVPGWRFIMLVLMALLGAGAASVAISFSRPRLAVLAPTPFLLIASTLQTSDRAVISSGVALALLVTALGVSYGVELSKEGATSGQFELRRLARGAISLLALVAALVAMAQLGFLFPESEQSQQIPPSKPPDPIPQADRVLFTVTSPTSGPWRMGVLDVYNGQDWLLPTYDTERFDTIGRSGEVASLVPSTEEIETIEFRIEDIGGNVIPSYANPFAIKDSEAKVQFDPRTQLLRLPEERATSGLTYTIEAPTPPSGKELTDAPPPGLVMDEFLEAPIPPNEVTEVLAEAPLGDWDRLQFVRNAFYEEVIASGAGTPVPVTPSRVVEILGGAEATPFEITASEAILARWAGIPSRIGYGFHSGDQQDGVPNVWEVRPSNGATWLEVYFEGHGWIPILGFPPKAKTSTEDSDKQQNPAVRPSDELALIVYVPIKLTTIQLLYVVVRYWAGVGLAVILGVAIAWWSSAGIAKMVRARVRRVRAGKAGVAGRVLTSYAEFRDSAFDLSIGTHSQTPLEFLDEIDEDDEHQELAWLVTRAIWGDVRRDLRGDDAEACEDLGRSVTKRLRGAQTIVSRVLAFGSRRSLREPYSAEIANYWPETRLSVRKLAASLNPLRWRKSVSARHVTTAGMLLLVVLMAGCSSSETSNGRESRNLPDPIAPETVMGFELQRELEAETAFGQAGEAGLVDDGVIYTVRDKAEVVGYLQIAPFKPDFSATQREVREGVLRSIGAGRFKLERIGRERIYTMRAGEQRFLLWYPPRGEYFALFVARHGFEEAGEVFASILAFQRGEDSERAAAGPVFDPRRGGMVD